MNNCTCLAELYTNFFDTTLLAGTMDSISARGQKSSTAYEMTRGRRLIARRLFDLYSDKCRNRP